MFIPFRLKGTDIITPLDPNQKDVLSQIPNTVMVLASKDIDLDAEPEDGLAGELAAALDEADDTRKRLEDAEKESEAAANTLQDRRKELQEAEKQVSDAARRAGKLLARMEQAEKTAASMKLKNSE